MTGLNIRNLTVSRDKVPLVQNFSLTINKGELASLLGPSGVGKTTLLKCIAGLLTETSGDIEINGEKVNDLPADKRDVVLMFQNPLLFPHLTVAKNVAFGLKMSHKPRSVIKEKIDTILDLTELSDLKKRKPHQLSGGQQQRVALARALVLEPSILLLDEPFVSLDSTLRQQMRGLIMDVQKKTGTTMLFVTHDQREALAISDRICLLLSGKARQIGAPQELHYHPADIDVAAFFGCTNRIYGAIQNGYFISRLGRCKTALPDSNSAQATIRPEEVVIHERLKPNCVEAKVQQLNFEGITSHVELQTANQTLTALVVTQPLHLGQTVWIRLPEEKIHIYPKSLLQ